MGHCFYHTDNGQNAVFHNCAIQTVFIQYLGDRSTGGHLEKNFQSHLYGLPVLTFAELVLNEH